MDDLCGELNGAKLNAMTSERVSLNPFVNLTPEMSMVQKLKMMVIGLFIGVPRLILMGAILVIMYICSIFVTIGHRRDLPLEKWRLHFQTPIRWGLRIQLFLFGFIWIKVKGRLAPKFRAPILVSNHISPFEPLFLVYYTKAAPLQRSEDSEVPVIGRIQQALQVVFVDRTSEASRRTCIESIIRRSDTSNVYPQVLVFPEGTCTNQQAILSFKNGAFLPAKSVQPILVRYKYTKCDPSFPAVSPTLIMLALRMICCLYHTMEVEFLDVYTPSAEEQKNALLYASNVQRLMAAKLGVPATQHAYEDAALRLEAQQLEVGVDEEVVEWATVQRILNIDRSAALHYLKVFEEQDSDHDTRISFAEFSNSWKRRCDDLLTEAFEYGSPSVTLTVEERELFKMFSVLDTDRHGSIDFRQFLAALCILNGYRKVLNDVPSTSNGAVECSNLSEFAEKHKHIISMYSNWIHQQLVEDNRRSSGESSSSVEEPRGYKTSIVVPTTEEEESRIAELDRTNYCPALSEQGRWLESAVNVSNMMLV